jgi:dephospho-CoA kinase
MENNVKLLIIGHARHGKDSLAEILNEHFGLKFISSSQACADIFIYDTLKEKYGYKTPEECYEDRMNRRQEWYEMICEYNKDDKARLAKEILKYNNTYVGMRDSSEIKECLKQGLFDLVIWVEASKRLPMESSNSFNITPSDADIIVDNNGTYEEFKEKTLRLGSLLRR